MLMDMTLKLNNAAVTKDQLERLRKVMPTSAEVKVLNAYSGDHNELGDVETFLLAFADMQDVQARIDCLEYWLEFPREQSRIREAVSGVRRACQEVRSGPNSMNMCL